MVTSQLAAPTVVSVFHSKRDLDLARILSLMIVCLEEVISSARVQGLVSLLENPELFESGAATAGRAAKKIKSNLQGTARHPEISRVVDKVRDELTSNPVFKRIAIPARIGRVMVSRYEPGMAYGTHFDDAFIDGVRTDISFTVFLSDPESYTGGELELSSPTGTQAIKLPAGCAIVYPSVHLHAVRPVTAGVRLAVVGWVQSRVRSPEERELLYELATATEAVAAAGADDSDLTRLRYVRNNLMRMWGDG